VCMTAAMLVLDPIFDADLPSEQYAYRAGRNAQQAVIDVEETPFYDHPDVVDADLADYFGSIPHPELMRSLAWRIVDGRVLHLTKMWLECTVEETDDRGRKTRTKEAKDCGRGIPQGSPVSPILSNAFLHYAFDLWMMRTYPDLPLCRYADDGLVHCRNEYEATAVKAALQVRLAECHLELHPTKTKIVYCNDGNRKGISERQIFGMTGTLPDGSRKSREVHVQVLREAGRVIPPADSPAHLWSVPPRLFLLHRKTRRDRMRPKLRALKGELKRRMHEPIPQQGRGLGQVVRGYFVYHAVPTNYPRLAAFRFHVTKLWWRTLRRRSQRDWTTWERISRLAAAYLPLPRILHPWPNTRFAVKRPSWEPGA
jgi:RNA-directed DNA polymerase